MALLVYSSGGSKEVKFSLINGVGRGDSDVGIWESKERCFKEKRFEAQEKGAVG